MATRLELTNKIDFNKSIPQFFPNSLFSHILNEELRSYIVDYVLDTYG